MTSLSEIPVSIEAGTGNVQPLLHELRHALGRLANGDEGTVIDLRGLPLAPGEEAKIEEALGEGEVRAELNALGLTTIQETAFSGVWMVTHRNTEDEVVARFIEVCRVPEILQAQSEDIQRSVHKLAQQLNGGALDGQTPVSEVRDTGSNKLGD
jgi:hydrogenase-1 operon protein HyaF